MVHSPTLPVQKTHAHAHTRTNTHIYTHTLYLHVYLFLRRHGVWIALLVLFHSWNDQIRLSLTWPQWERHGQVCHEPWFTSETGSYVPKEPSNTAKTRLLIRRLVRKSENRLFPRNRGAQDSTEDAGECREWSSLKSALWLERSYPLPSPRGIKGLFLGAASVERRTALTDLKHREQPKEASSPCARTAHSVSTRTEESHLWCWPELSASTVRVTTD